MTMLIRPDSFADVTRSLTDLFNDVEEKFLTVGNRLGDAMAVFTTLTTLFGALPEELETRGVQEAAADLQTVAGAVAAMGDDLGQEQAALSDLTDLNHSVGQGIDQLGKTVATIAVLTVNARIAAAGITTGRAEFAVFTNEIARLATSVAATIDHYHGECRSLAKLLESASAAQTRFERDHRNMLRTVARQLVASLDEVAARRRQAAGAAIEIRDSAGHIAGEIGVIVTALQIGDITRQRVEHVAHALTLLGNGLPPGMADQKRVDQEGAGQDFGDATMTAAQQQAVAAAILRLQSDQLAGAAADFRTEVERSTAALKRLASEAAAMTALGSRTYGTDRQDGGSFLDDLETRLRGAEDLIGKCRSARAEVDRVVQVVAGAVDGLLARITSVRRIEIDIRLVGLNMALKCGRLGTEGQTLRVIAQELRVYAHQILRDVEALMAAVQRIGIAAGKIASDRRGQGDDILGALDGRMAHSMENFRHVGARLGQVLQTLSGEGHQVARTLAETAMDLTGTGRIMSTLEDARVRLDTLAAATPEAGDDHGALAEYVRAFMSSHYTMASERDIHQKSRGHQKSGRGAGPATAALSAAPAGTSVEDFLF